MQVAIATKVFQKRCVMSSHILSHQGGILDGIKKLKQSYMNAKIIPDKPGS
jgi:hypothetical protein